jgi:hypothetical protein
MDYYASAQQNDAVKRSRFPTKALVVGASFGVALLAGMGMLKVEQRMQAARLEKAQTKIEAIQKLNDMYKLDLETRAKFIVDKGATEYETAINVFKMVDGLGIKYVKTAENRSVMGAIRSKEGACTSMSMVLRSALRANGINSSMVEVLGTNNGFPIRHAAVAVHVSGAPKDVEYPGKDFLLMDPAFKEVGTKPKFIRELSIDQESVIQILNDPRLKDSPGFAIAQLEKAIKIDENSIFARIALAGQYVSIYEFEKAERVFKEAMKRDKSNFAREAYSEFLYSQGRRKESLALTEDED